MDKNKLIALVVVLFVGSGVTYWLKSSHHEQVAPPNWNQQEQVPPPSEIKPEEKPDAPVAGQPKTYAEALKLSAQTGKKVFIYFSADWCGKCREMTPTFSDPVVKTALAEYVDYKLNVDREKEVARKYKIPAIPHYIIIDANEKVYNEGAGVRNPEQFLRWLRK